MTLDQIRALYPHTEHTIYLNHAATAPLGTHVVEAMNAFIAERHGSQIDNYFLRMPRVQKTRQMLATLFGTTLDRIDFVPSTTHGLNIVAQGLNWQAGDRVAFPACEFPANAYPFLYLEKRGVEIDLIPHTDGTFTLEDVAKALTPKTKLLTLSWVQFLSGFKAPIQEIGALCKEKGVFFCVDAIQGVGGLHLGNVDELGIDFLTGGVQKWMMSDQGLAYFYISEALQAQVAPAMAGWLGVQVDWNDFFNYNLQFYEDATQFRIGTANNLGIAALEAALQLHLELTPQWCEAHISKLTKQLWDGLAQLGFVRYGTDDPRYASGIVTVSHPQSQHENQDIFDYLNAHNITISYRNKLLRFSPTFYNSEAEISRTLDVLQTWKNGL